jgi:hypothetical protein
MAWGRPGLICGLVFAAQDQPMQAKSSQAMDQAFLKLPKYAAQAWPSQAVMPISMAQADPSGQNMRSRAQDFQAGPSQAAYGQIYARHAVAGGKLAPHSLAPKSAPRSLASSLQRASILKCVGIEGWDLKIVLPNDQQKNSFSYRSDLAPKKKEKCKKADLGKRAQSKR